MIPLIQSSTITQSSDKYVSHKSSSSSLTKKQADNAQDSFAIPYINDYATYVWAYDLSSHPELLMATYPLKSNTQLNKSVVKRYKTSQDVLKFTDSVYASFLRKEEVRQSAELQIAYTFFVYDYRGAMQVKLLTELQKACEYFRGWR
ncbi:MAG: hypothetical protein EZS28_042624 [Streblomastix strix]|uniref:Uncharacterized protein n=1 Tax=Streblomastix strix TaxID=222440 RepID=A0A5J4TV00_9EUKA|nr:MAG: hypothetical protein EZS28_042624 [Streblomastix strix]